MKACQSRQVWATENVLAGATPSIDAISDLKVLEED
jgi:hypothetical protein